MGSHLGGLTLLLSFEGGFLSYIDRLLWWY